MNVGIDTGKHQVKYAYVNNGTVIVDNFPSLLQPYIPTNIDLDLTGKDYIIEHNKKKYFCGELAEREQTIPISYKDQSKAHTTTLINTLNVLALLPDTNFNIVVGSPISQRTNEEKNKIKEMLLGSHRFVFNNQEKIININKCEVSPEGMAAVYSLIPPQPNIQGLDIGSSTINYFFMQNKKFVNRKCGTFPFNSEESQNIEMIMEGVYSNINNKFNKEFLTILVGGLAEKFFPYVKKFYPNTAVAPNYLYSTAIGFLKIARKIYG